MKADRVPRAEDHREENYTKENSRDLQKVPLKYSTMYWSGQVHEEAIQGGGEV